MACPGEKSHFILRVINTLGPTLEQVDEAIKIVEAEIELYEKYVVHALAARKHKKFRKLHGQAYHEQLLFMLDALNKKRETLSPRVLTYSSSSSTSESCSASEETADVSQRPRGFHGPGGGPGFRAPPMMRPPPPPRMGFPHVRHHYPYPIIAPIPWPIGVYRRCLYCGIRRAVVPCPYCGRYYYCSEHEMWLDMDRHLAESPHTTFF